MKRLKYMVIAAIVGGVCFMSSCKNSGAETASRPSFSGNQGVYYEIYVGSFADSNGDGIGDLPGLTHKLDYLKDLGITGIWLMPVHPSPSYHKYDITDYYAIDPQYGTLEDFENLIAKAKEYNIHIIMDMVFDGTSNVHPWFKSAVKGDETYRDYYIWYNKNPEAYDLDAKWNQNPVWIPMRGDYYAGIYSRVLPDLNLQNPAVREEIKNIASFWLDKGVSGFRLDSVPHLYAPEKIPAGMNGREECLSWWAEFSEHCREIKEDIYLVGEILDTSAVRAPYVGVLGSSFNFDVAHTIRSAWQNGNGSMFDRNITGFLEYLAQHSDGYTDAPILSNHDLPRIMHTLEGDITAMKLFASVYLTLEGTPFMYYGEELGMRGTTQGGDQGVRTPFLWGGSDPCQTTNISDSENADTPTLDVQMADPESLYSYYKRLIELRLTNEALYNGSFQEYDLVSPSLAGYRMSGEQQEAVIIHNMDDAPESISPLPDGFTHIFSTDGTLHKNLDGMEIPPYHSYVFVK